MPATILIAEDHEVVRDGLRQLIAPSPDFEVVAEAGDGRAAVELARKHRPDIVVMDIWLPLLSGIEATRQIVESNLPSKVLVLSQHDSWHYVEESLKAGAAGYMIKTSSSADLLAALRAVCQGKCYLSPDIAQQLVEAFARPDGERSLLASITSREREVLQLIAEGFSSKEIATQLGVSVRTVEAHRSSLMQKLGIHKVSGLVRFAIREGLVAP